MAWHEKIFPNNFPNWKVNKKKEFNISSMNKTQKQKTPPLGMFKQVSETHWCQNQDTSVLVVGNTTSLVGGGPAVGIALW